jgi:hypothetical protein
MANKGKHKIEFAVEHYSSKLYISSLNTCSECPLKIYADDKDTIIFGTGNINSNTIMILPSYDVKAGINYNTILKIVQDSYKNIKGTNLLEDCYVTRSIKCLDKTDFNLEDSAINYCLNNLIYEIYRINPNKIIIFDKRLYDLDLYELCIGIYNIKTVISPAVMYYNNQKLHNIFIKQLTEAINDS